VVDTRSLQVLEITLPPPSELDELLLRISPVYGRRAETVSFNKEP